MPDENPGAEKPHRHHRRTGAQLPGNESHGQQAPERQRGDDFDTAPAGTVPAHQPPYQPDRGAGHQHEPAYVESGTGSETLRDATERERDGDQTNRDVEPEDPLPR